MAHSTNGITTAEETSTNPSYGMLDGPDQYLDTPCDAITVDEFVLDSLLLDPNPYQDPPERCSSSWQPFVSYTALQCSSSDWTFTPDHHDVLAEDFLPEFEYMISSIGGQFDLPYVSVSSDTGIDGTLTSYQASNDFSATPIWTDLSCVSVAYLANSVSISRDNDSITWPGSEPIVVPITRSSTVSSISSSASSDSDRDLPNSVLSNTDSINDQRHPCDHRNCTRLFKTAKQLS